MHHVHCRLLHLTIVFVCIVLSLHSHHPCYINKFDIYNFKSTHFPHIIKNILIPSKMDETQLLLKEREYEEINKKLNMRTRELMERIEDFKVNISFYFHHDGNIILYFAENRHR